MALGRVVGPGQTAYRRNQDLFARELVAFENQALQNAMLGVGLFVQQAGSAAIATAAAEAKRVTSRQLTEMIRLFEQGLAASDRLALHQRIGRQAVQSTVRSFQGTAKRTNNQSGYRSGDNQKWRRYSGGRLLAALRSERMFNATADTLEWINVDHLNKAAAQWARLNFGAGSVGKGSLPLKPVTFGGVVLASLGLDEPARPAFWMPEGYFVGGDGQPVGAAGRSGVAFYPRGTGPKSMRGMNYMNAEGKRVPIPFIKRRMTQGIRGRNFLDVGAQRIAREIGPGYEQLFRQLAQRGEATVRPTRWNITVPPRARIR